MEININRAVDLFFKNTSFEYVFFEAIANSIDARATNISIFNRLKEKDSKTIEIDIVDNGNGFVEENFKKFKKLLDSESPDHKGVGRLVFLTYFETVDIVSIFDDKKREFKFNKNFNGESQVTPCGETRQTKLTFTGFTKDRLKSYDDVKPIGLKESIVRHFFPILYEMKIKKTLLEIFISYEVTNESGDVETETATIKPEHLEDLEELDIKPKELGLFANLKILYSIKRNNNPTSIITALCVDGRAIPIPLIERNQIPEGCELIFVVFSNLFTGKTDLSRQTLELKEYEMKTLKSIMLKQLSKILASKIPEIHRRNKVTIENFAERYPHLSGYFENEMIGLINRDSVLDNAQRKFFHAQREILDAVDLDDVRYEQSIEISSRLLMNYILYRTMIINKLKTMNKENSEGEIHNIIIPMKRSFAGKDIENQFFFNNTWILDDRFMSFSTIASDLELQNIADNLKIDGEILGKTRPDITIIFSDEIRNEKKVDVVIVELKKIGLKLAKKEEVISQLRQRARKLLEHYPNKIQRIWLYGIVDFDNVLIRALKEDSYVELFSRGHIFYREYQFQQSDNSPDIVPTSVFILDYNAIINDAEARNSAFLNLLKSAFKQPVDDFEI